MDLLSTYAVLQNNRHVLNLPYFTLREFCAALYSREPGARFLLQTILNLLLLKLNIRPPFMNSGNQSLQFYNHPQSKSKKLEFMSKFQYLKDLPVEGVLEMMNQMICVVLSSEYQFRVDGTGSFMKQEGDQYVIQKTKDEMDPEEVQSFFTLGFDIFANEYYMLYPDILLIISPHEKLPFLEDPINYEEWLQEIQKLEAENVSLYKNLGNYLLQNEFVVENDSHSQFSTINQQSRENSRFYGFTSEASTQSKFFEDCQLLADEVCKEIHECGLKDLEDLLGNLGTPASEESEESEQELGKRKSKPTYDQHKMVLQSQLSSQKGFEYKKPNAKDFEIAQQLASCEVSYVQLIQGAAIKYSQQGVGCKLKQKDLYQHFIQIGEDQQLLEKVVNYQQFSLLELLKRAVSGEEQLPNGKELTAKNFPHIKQSLALLCDHTFSLCHGLVDFYFDFRQTVKDHKYYYDVNNFEQFKQLSRTDNNINVNPLEVADDYITFKFTRSINVDIGDKKVLVNYPLFIRNKTSFPRAQECTNMRIHLGYEAPKIEVIVPDRVQSSSESSEYEEEEEKPRRRRGSKYYDFSDEDYVSEYYDAPVSDSYELSSSTTTEDEDDNVVWEQREVTIETYDRTKMEILTDDGVLADPQVFNKPSLICRVWSSPEELETERARRKKSSDRKMKIEQNRKNGATIRKKHKVRRQKTRGRRSCQIVVTSENIGQYSAMNQWVEKQRKEMELLKAKIFNKQNPPVAQNPAQAAQRYSAPNMKQQQQPRVPAYGVNPKALQQPKPQYYYQQPQQFLNMATGQYQFGVPPPQIPQPQQSQPRQAAQPQYELPNPKELKKVLARSFAENYERELSERVAVFLDEYEAQTAGRRGRIPDSFYQGLRQVFKASGREPRDYFERKEVPLAQSSVQGLSQSQGQGQDQGQVVPKSEQLPNIWGL